MGDIAVLSPSGTNAGMGLDHTENSHLSKQCSYSAYLGEKFYEYVAVIEMLHLLATSEQARKQLFESIEGSNFWQWQKKRTETLGWTYEFLKEQWFGDPAKAEQAREAAKESLEEWESHRSAFLNSLKDALLGYYNEILKRYRDCGVAYAFATVATDGAFTLGELAIGAGVAGVAAKTVKSLKFFVRRTANGNIEVRVENPNGGAYAHAFSQGNLEAKYGKPEENHAGILQEDTNRPVNERLSRDQYGRLRRRTPSEKIRRQVRSQFPNASRENPVSDEWLPGLQRTAPVEADHIVSMKEITGMSGFSSLNEADQLDILNMAENFTGLSRAANASKSDLTFGQWTHHKATGTSVSPELREEFMKKEREVREKIQKEIERRLREKKDTKKDTITYRDD